LRTNTKQVNNPIKFETMNLIVERNIAVTKYSFFQAIWVCNKHAECYYNLIIANKKQSNYI